MKAEHRKELETNELADRMGRLVERVKHRPQGRGFFYLILLGVLAGVLFWFWYLNRQSTQLEAESWFFFELANDKQLKILGKVTDGDSRQPDQEVSDNVKRASRFQLAWQQLWDEGIRKLGADSRGALRSVGEAEKIYKALAEECQGDPVWEPEALYNLAVITETRAVQSRDNLEKAITKFREVAKKHKESGYGQLALARANHLEENLAGLKSFYERLQSGFNIEGADGVGLPKLNLPVPPPLK